MDYKEKLKAIINSDKTPFVDIKTFLKYFPEFKKSEDERIADEIIQFLLLPHPQFVGKRNYEEWIAWIKKQSKYINFRNKIQVGDKVTRNEAGSLVNLSQLNRVAKKHKEQGEQKLTPIFRIGDTIIAKDGTYIEKEPFHIDRIEDDCYWDGENTILVCNQDEFEIFEQTPADKVEPKFEIEKGKWYVCISQFCNCIEGRNYKASLDGRIIDDYGTEYDMHDDAYKWFRPWIIEDAKDGDALIDKSHGRECPFIFKETKPSDIKTDVLNPLTVLGYCGIGGAGFTKGSGWGDTANCIYYPATKEQRDLLFSKMHEAGYEWDADKKKLKKISQRMISAKAKEALYDKPAWSEEDEKKRNLLINILEVNHPNDHFKVNPVNTLNMEAMCTEELVSWLNSIKEKVQPKQEWSGEDEEYSSYISAALQCYYRLRENRNNTNGQENLDKAINWLYNRLKSLRPQNTWKPSDEQITWLYRATDDASKDSRMKQVLNELLSDLKKLREK